MIDNFNVMQIYKTEGKMGNTEPFGCENLSTCVGFDETKAAAWFEYTNRTTNKRHQVWFEDPRSVQAKTKFVFETAGLHGVAFWRGNEVYGTNTVDDLDGRDSVDAQAMWQAADPRLVSGGYGFCSFHSAPSSTAVSVVKNDDEASLGEGAPRISPRIPSDFSRNPPDPGRV